MKKYGFLIFLFLGNIIHAQTSVNIAGVFRDTSFTLQSVFAKEVKRRPYIQIVYPQHDSKIISFESVTYSQPSLNRELKLNIYRPADTKSYPALLMVHGGGWSSGNLSLQIPMAQKIAEHDYVTIPVEYRLSPEAKYPAAVYDLKTAIRWIRANASKFNIDTSRIAISGCSAGGQLATLIGTTNYQQKYEGKGEYRSYSSLINAVINIDGICDFTQSESIQQIEKEVSKGKQPASVRWFGGTYSECRERWIEASPLHHVTYQSAPVCFINSSIPRFHDGRDEMIAELSKYSIYTEVHTFDDTPHTFWLFSPWFGQTVRYMTDFLDRTLKNIKPE